MWGMAFTTGVGGTQRSVRPHLPGQVAPERREQLRGQNACPRVGIHSAVRTGSPTFPLGPHRFTQIDCAT